MDNYYNNNEQYEEFYPSERQFLDCLQQLNSLEKRLDVAEKKISNMQKKLGFPLYLELTKTKEIEEKVTNSTMKPPIMKPLEVIKEHRHQEYKTPPIPIPNLSKVIMPRRYDKVPRMKPINCN